MKILLTGGCGFIGSHTAVELHSAGYDVVIADNFSNSSPDVLGRLEKICGAAFPFYQLDVCNKTALSDLFEKEHIVGVIHFAGWKAVGESVKKPLDYYENNLESMLSLLSVMKDFGVSLLVFSSSATVYGVPERVPLTEDMPTGCTNPYGWTKWMIEQMLRDYAFADPDFSVVNLRYFNPVGAHESGWIGERPNGIPNNLMPYITKVAKGELSELHVFGKDYPTRDGTGVRDYIHVVDLAKGHISALEYGMNHRGFEVFNLGTGNGYSVLELVKTFEAVNQIEVPYVIDGRRSGDVAECYADVSKANTILGWKAEKDLESMCRDAWRWEKNCKN